MSTRSSLVIDWVDRFVLSGPRWEFKAVLVCVVFGALFSYNLEWICPSGLPLPQAYSEKSQHPLAPVDAEAWTGHPGEISHGKKINTRLVGNLSLWVANRIGLPPYAGSTLMGLIFLFCILRAGEAAACDRRSGFLLCLLVAGIFASSSAFAVTYMPKPFDGIALGFLGMTLLPHAWLVFTGTFLGAWTDERVLLGAAISALFLWKRTGSIRLILVVVYGGLAYGLVRWVMFQQSDFQPDFSMLQIRPIFLLPLLAIALQGGLVVLGLYWWNGLRDRTNRVEVATLSICFLGMALLSTVARDVSRAGIFLVPILPLCLLGLKQMEVGLPRLRRLLLLACLVSFLIPEIDWVAGEGFNFGRPLPLYWLAGR